MTCAECGLEMQHVSTTYEWCGTAIVLPAEFQIADAEIRRNYDCPGCGRRLWRDTE